jgi:hypothetical protein
LADPDRSGRLSRTPAIPRLRSPSTVMRQTLV